MASEFYGRTHSSTSFGLVADWTQALNDRSDLAEVVIRLMKLVKASTAIISRSSLAHEKIEYIARCDEHAGKVWSGPPRSFAKQLLGENLLKARAGSVWKLSEASLCEHTHMMCDAQGRSNDVFEVVICALETQNGHADFLELHYRHRPAQHDLDLIAMLVETLSIGWRKRVPGLVAKKLSRKTRFVVAREAEERNVPVLSIENPANLSRCEFRVCCLLKEGLTVNSIAEALSVGPATVRSHLSSVFSKTHTANQVELLHELNRPGHDAGSDVASVAHGRA